MPAETIHILESDEPAKALGPVVQSLRDGGLVVLPTETIYGVAGILNSGAREKLLEVRGPGKKPLTIHLPNRTAAFAYIGQTSDLAKRMMRKLWPGPVGISFDVPASRRAEVARKLKLDEADLYFDGAITLRCPDHIVTTAVLEQVDGPVALTAMSDPPSKVVVDHVSHIVNTGPTRFNKPSTILKVSGEKFEIVREGIFDERIIKRLLRTTVVFVCSGNTCRSPMAEAVAKKIISKKMKIPVDQLEDRGICVISAGTFAYPGARATSQAVQAVSELGADLSKHRSRPLSVELIHQADVIYTMGRSHLAAVVSLVPSAAEIATTLDPSGDVEDPIGSDVSVYKSLAEHFESLIATRLEEDLFSQMK